MEEFIRRFSGKVAGTLEGFDRVMFRGTARLIAHVHGMKKWLWMRQILLKDFGDYASDISQRLKAASVEAMEGAGRPVRYLSSAATSKEEVARRIAAEDGVVEGPVCALTCVEPCMSFDVHRNKDLKRLELVSRVRKCLHIYHYWIDPELGWMNARLQTWLPLTVKVCINGRRWLARQMERAGIGHTQRDNCFTAVNDFAAAQTLLAEQLKTDWPALLDGVLSRLSPGHAEVFAECRLHYYWSADETEWATDVVFTSPEALQGLYARLIGHAMHSLSSGDVMRFLSRPMPAIVRPGRTGVHGNFAGEVVSDLRTRPEGMRVKHRLNRNSVKMYDKQGRVLRVETTINDPRDIKVYRTKEGEAGGVKKWHRMRKGVADLNRRAEVSSRSNARYLAALAAADTEQTVGDLLGKISRPVRRGTLRGRGLNPMNAADARLLETVARGEFAINGFRNRDLRLLLCGADPNDPGETKRRAGRITRQIRLLRAHGLVRKINGTHRYQLTVKGRLVVTAVTATRNTTPAKLAAAA